MARVWIWTGVKLEWKGRLEGLRIRVEEQKKKMMKER
jgi:hypothetical protein